MKKDISYQEIKDAHEMGLSPKEIAFSTMLGVATIYKVLKELGLEANARRSKLDDMDPERTEGFIEDYKHSYLTLAELWRKWDLDPHMCQRLIKELELTRDLTEILALENCTLKTTEVGTPLDRAIKLYQNGMSLNKITQQTGIYPSRMYAEMELLGIPTRNVANRERMARMAIESLQRMNARLAEKGLPTSGKG